MVNTNNGWKSLEVGLGWYRFVSDDIIEIIDIEVGMGWGKYKFGDTIKFIDVDSDKEFGIKHLTIDINKIPEEVMNEYIKGEELNSLEEFKTFFDSDWKLALAILVVADSPIDGYLTTKNLKSYINDSIGIEIKIVSNVKDNSLIYAPGKFSYNLEREKFIINKWERVKDLLWIKKMNKYTFNVISFEIVDYNGKNNVGLKRSIVDTDVLTKSEIDSYLKNSAYKSLRHLTTVHNTEWRQALAEIIAEQAIIDSYMTMEEFILYIKEHTGMDIENKHYKS